MKLKEFNNQWSKFTMVKYHDEWFRIQGIDYENCMVCLESNDWILYTEIQSVSKWFIYFWYFLIGR